MPTPENIRRILRVLREVEKMDRTDLLYVSQKISGRMEALEPKRRGDDDLDEVH